MKKIAILFSLLAALVCSAQDTQTTITITVTNLPQNNLSTITANSSTLYWTNTTGNGNGYITIGGDVGGNATNLWNQLGIQGVTGANVSFAGTNQVVLIGFLNQSMAVALSGTGTSAGWGYLTTNVSTFTNQITVAVPLYAYPLAGTRTNVASLIVSGIDSMASNEFTVNLFTNNWSGLSASNAVLTSTTISNSAFVNNFLSYSTNYGSYDTNGTRTNGFSYGEGLTNPRLTNGVNYGNAFQSPGAGANSLQLGNSASATGTTSLAIGSSASATNSFATAIGNGTVAGGTQSTAIGDNASAITNNATAVGVFSSASARGSSAFGTASTARGTNCTALGSQTDSGVNYGSTAIGFGATCNASYQIMLGGSGVNVIVQNLLSVLGSITNSTFVGTNNWIGDLAWQVTNNSAMTGGNNSGVALGTAVNVNLTGSPSSSFTICGLAGGRDGRVLVLENATSQSWSIANDSGNEPTPANRIYIGTGGTSTVTSTNLPSTATFIYNAAQSHWVMISLSGSAFVTGGVPFNNIANNNGGTLTNPIVVGSFASNQSAFHYGTPSGFTNGSGVGAAVAFNNYYTNTFGSRVTASIAFSFTDQISLGAFIGVFPFQSNGAVRLPVYQGIPAGVAASTTNTVLVNLDPGGYIGITNLQGTVAILTNEIQQW